MAPSSTTIATASTATATATATRAASTTTSSRSSYPHKRRVIVIGAGMAGLAAARELQHRRYQVLVIEARSRVGGRVHGVPVVTTIDDIDASTCSTTTTAATATSTTTTANVDVGGAIIHGIDNNPLTKLCQQLGVHMTKSLQDCLLLNQSGWPVDPKVDEKVSQHFNDVLETTFERIQQLPTTKSTITTTSATKESFGTVLNMVREEAHITPSPLWNWHQNNLELSCGAPLNELGYAWNDDEPYGFEGNHVALAKSWNTVTERLAEGLDILYNCPIQGIRVVEQQKPSSRQHAIGQDISPADTATSTIPTSRTPSVVPILPSSRRCSNRHTKKPTKFTISSHSTLSYDTSSFDTQRRSKNHKPTPPKVLVELSNGNVLQADAVICTLPLGVLKSKTVTFDPPLSTAKQYAVDSLGCGLLNKCVLTFSTVFWQDSDFIGLTGDTSPYLILNGHVITSHPILIFMFGGASAYEVEKKTDEDIMKECMQVLRTICHNRTPPEPMDHVITRWGHDPYSRMSFSFVPPGVNGMTQLTALSEPIVSTASSKQPLVLFAGEHTTPFHPSTIHGAFLSGIREAYRLDLALEPKLNDFLKFESEYVYQKTFTLKRKLSEANRVSIMGEEKKPKELGGTSRTGALLQQRRHGVMTLRKRKSPMPTMTSVTATNGSNALPSPRKSQRRFRVHFGETAESADPPTKVATTWTNSQRVAQEDRTLDRLASSYYPSWNLIANKVLPLYGTTNKKASVLKQRYQSIRKSVKKSKPKLELMNNWLAEDQYIVKENGVVAPLPVTSANSANGINHGNSHENGKCRRSDRMVARRKEQQK